MDAIRENVSALTLLAEILCLLDMIVNSFAHMISTKPVDQYTRPEFTGKKICNFCNIFGLRWRKLFIYILFYLPESGPMAIDSGRHPILESIHNDFVVSNEHIR
jgi:DNA mismatch repair protein MSH4